MTRQRKLVVAILAALPLLVAACSEGTNLPAGPQSASASASPVGNPAAVVTLQYSSFEPAIVTISAGQTVEWQWMDSPIPHDIYLQEYFPASGAITRPVALDLHSAIMVTGTWFHTFTQPGTYYYICTVHAGMFGRVIVTGSPRGAAAGSATQ